MSTSMYGPIQADEKLAAALGRLTGAWSLTELNLTILFSVLTKLDLNMAAAIFDVFRSTHTQTTVMNRVARVSDVVSDDQRQTLKQLMADYGRLAEKRNEVVHNPLGWTDATNTSVYLMLKTRGVPGPEGIPYRTRLLSIAEIDGLTHDLATFHLRLMALLTVVAKLPPPPARLAHNS